VVAFAQFVLNGVIAGALYALIAMGVAIIYGGTGHFHIAHAGVFLLGGYLTEDLAAHHVPLVPALIVGVVAATCLGVLIDRLIYAPLERRGGGKVGIFLSSLGVLYVVSNLLVIWLGDAPVYASVPQSMNQPISLGGPTITGLEIVLIAGTAVLLVALLALMRFTRLGALIRALSSNMEQIRISGRSVTAARVMVYALGSALAGVAGVYTLVSNGLTVSIGEEYFMLAFVAVILGGVGSLAGAFWAAMLIGLIENIVQNWVANQWAEPIVFGAFLVAIVLAPHGLAGVKIGRPRRSRTTPVGQASVAGRGA
jgi:branched-chain amino acid transport system permease protein